MDISLIEQLLYESESSYLDFKKNQYDFANAEENRKSELLKDILAFTNSWRQTDAYILIGVEEVKGDKSNVIGVKDHLDDHAIQQFVNGKTQDPITFSYIPFDYYGKQIGIICIPVQKRPIYITKKFGKVEKNVVYIRRGSSTAIASPDEVAKMGAASISALSQLSIDLQFADIYKRELLGRELELNSTILQIPNRNNIPDFSPERNRFEITSVMMNQPERDYYRHLVRYFEDNLLVNPISFGIVNMGNVNAQNVRLQILFEKEVGLKIFSEANLPTRPRKYFNLSEINTSLYSSLRIDKINTELNNYGNKWILEIKFGSVQPKAYAWADEVIYIGCKKEKNITVSGKIFADNLSEPLSIPLSFLCHTKIFEADIKTIENILDEEKRKKLDELFDEE